MRDAPTKEPPVCAGRKKQQKIKVGDEVSFSTLGTQGKTFKGIVVEKEINAGTHVKIEVPQNGNWFVPCEDVFAYWEYNPSERRPTALNGERLSDGEIELMRRGGRRPTVPAPKPRRRK